MGSALYIIAKDKPDGMDLFVNGKALSKASARLTSVAKKLGVRELMSFFSQNPDDAADFVEDISTLPAEQWFDPVDGLVTVRALITHFSVAQGGADVIEELREFEAVLQRLKDAGLLWHLAVDF
jgi:hypothetical protein